MGSFYGEAGSPFARTPVRSFTTADSDRFAHLVVMHVAEDTYLLVACSFDPTPPLAPLYCSVSSTGGFARYTGRAWYEIVGASIKLSLQVFATW